MGSCPQPPFFAPGPFLCATTAGCTSRYSYPRGLCRVSAQSAPHLSSVTTTVRFPCKGDGVETISAHIFLTKCLLKIFLCHCRETREGSSDPRGQQSLLEIHDHFGDTPLWIGVGFFLPYTRLQTAFALYATPPSPPPEMQGSMVIRLRPCTT